MGKKRISPEIETFYEGVDIPQRLYPRTEEECITEHQLIEVLREKMNTRELAFKSREAELLQRIADYEADGEYSLFFSMNRKANETSRSLNSFELSFTTESKSFERYVMIIKIMPEQTATLDRLRQDYLKIDKDEVKEVEKKGIPLIEQQRQAISAAPAAGKRARKQN